MTRNIYAEATGAITMGGGGGTPAADAQRLVRNANLIARNFPQFADDPGMLLRLAGVPMDSGPLASQIQQLASARVADGDIQGLRDMSEASQRIMWDGMSSGQQQAYSQLGYSPPSRKHEGSDIWGADALGNVFKPLGAAWEIGNKIAEPVIGYGMGALNEFVGEPMGEMYRAIRQQPEWVQVLAGVVATGAAVALTAATAGVAVPGLASIGAGLAATGVGVGTGTTAVAALTAGYTAAGIAAMTQGDTGYWARTFDDKWNREGEGVFERGAQVRATQLLEDDGSILDLAQSLALTPQKDHGDTSPVARLLREFASRPSATSDQARTAAIEELAARTEAPVGSQPYIEAYSALEELSRQPRFMEALSHLERSKISWGRDVGDALHLPAGSVPYNLVSGASDAMFLLAVDPMMAAGKVLMAQRALKFGVKAADMATFDQYVVRIEALTKEKSVQTAWGRIADFMARDDAATMAKQMPSSTGLIMPLKEWETARKLSMTDITTDFSWSADEVAEFFKAQAGFKAMGAGRSMSATPNHLLMVPHLTPVQSAFLRARTELKGGIAHLDDKNLSFRWELPPGLGAEYEAIAKMASPGLTNPEAPMGAGIFLGFVDHVPILRTVAESAGTFAHTMLTRIPSSGTVMLNTRGKLAARSVEDLVALTDLGRVFGMPTAVRTQWANMMINAGTAAERRVAVRGFYATLFHHLGVANTPEGLGHVKRFIAQQEKAYALGRDVGTWLGDAADFIAIPNIVEMRKAVRNQTFLNKFLNLADADFINLGVSKIWKPSVLLRFGFITRAVGDEMISWLARDGMYGVVASTLARSAVKPDTEMIGHAKWVGGLAHVMHGGKNQVLTKFGRAAEEFNPKMTLEYSRLVRDFYQKGLLNSRMDKLPGSVGRITRSVLTPDHRLRTLALNGVPEHYIRAGRAWFDHPLVRDAIMKEASATKSGVAHDIASPDPFRDNSLYTAEDQWAAHEIAKEMRLSNEWELVDPRSSRYDYHAWKNQNRVNSTDTPFDGDELSRHLVQFMDPHTIGAYQAAGYTEEQFHDVLAANARLVIDEMTEWDRRMFLGLLAKNDPTYTLAVNEKRLAAMAGEEDLGIQMLPPGPWVEPRAFKRAVPKYKKMVTDPEVKAMVEPYLKKLNSMSKAQLQAEMGDLSRLGELASADEVFVKQQMVDDILNPPEYGERAGNWRDYHFARLGQHRDARQLWAGMIEDTKTVPPEWRSFAEMALRMSDNEDMALRGWSAGWLDHQRTSPGTGIVTDWTEAERDVLIGQAYGNQMRASSDKMESYGGLEDSIRTAKSGRTVARPAPPGTQYRYLPSPTVGGIEKLEEISRLSTGAVGGAVGEIMDVETIAANYSRVMAELEAVADARTVEHIKRIASEFAGYPAHVVDLMQGGFHRPIWWAFSDPEDARKITEALNALAGMDRVDMAGQWAQVLLPDRLGANAHISGFWGDQSNTVRLIPEYVQNSLIARPGEGLISINGELIPGATAAEAMAEHLEVKTLAHKELFHSNMDKDWGYEEGPQIVRRDIPHADPDAPHWMPEDAEYSVNGRAVGVEHMDGMLDDGGDPFVILPNADEKGARVLIDPFAMEQDFNMGAPFLRGQTPDPHGNRYDYEIVLDDPGAIQTADVVMEDEVDRYLFGTTAPHHEILEGDPGPTPGSEQWKRFIKDDTSTVYVFPPPVVEVPHTQMVSRNINAEIEPYATDLPDGYHITKGVQEDVDSIYDKIEFVVEGKVVGSAFATRNAEGRYMEASVWVAPEFRRQGIATEMYHRLELEGIPIESVSGRGVVTPAGAEFFKGRRAKQAGPGFDLPFDTHIALMDEGIRVLKVVDPTTYEQTLSSFEDFTVRMDVKATQSYVDPLTHEVVVPIGYGAEGPELKISAPPGVSPRTISEHFNQEQIAEYIKARALASQRVYGLQLGGDVRKHTDQLIEDVVDQIIGLPWGRINRIGAGVSAESTEISAALNDLGVTTDELLAHLSPTGATLDDFAAGAPEGAEAYRNFLTDIVAMRAGGSSSHQAVHAALRKVGYPLPGDELGNVSRVLWESVGPMMLESRWEKGWVPITDAEDLPVRFADPNDMRHVPSGDRPRGIVRPKYKEGEHPGWWDKLVQFGFGKVIGPMIDKLMRTPFAFNNFAHAYRDVEGNHAWLRDPLQFSPPTGNKIVDVYASTLKRPWQPGEHALLSGLSSSHGAGDLGRFLEYSKNEPWFTVYGHPSQWLRTHFDEVKTWARTRQETDLLDILDNVEVTATPTAMAGSGLALYEGEGTLHRATREAMSKAENPNKMKPAQQRRLEQDMIADGIIVPGETYYIGIGRLRADGDALKARIGEKAWIQKHYARWEAAGPSTVEKGMQELLDAGPAAAARAGVGYVENLPAWARDHFSQNPWMVQALKRAHKSADLAKEHAVGLAIERTIVDTLPFIDRDNVRSQWQQYVKNIFPFWFAEDQFIRRTLKTVINNPEALRKAQLVYQGLKSGGVIQQDEYGQDIFVYPGSTALAEVIAKLPWLSDAAPVASAMTGQVLYSLPGLDRFAVPQVSPLIAIPMAQMSALYPELGPVQEALSGQRGQGQGIVRAIVPTSVFRFYDAIMMGDGDRKLASATMSVLAVMEANGHGLPDNATVEEQQHHIDRAQQQARVMMLAQAITGFVGPASPQMRLVGDPDQPGKSGNPWDFGNLLGTSAVDVMLNDEYVQMVQNLGAEEGTLAFLARYPDSTPEDLFNSNLVYKIGKSKSVAGAPIPPTKAANDWLNANREYVEANPHASAWMVPPARTQEEAAERDTATWMEQISLGLRVNKAPDEFLRDIKFGVASERYFTVREEMQKAIDDENDAEHRADMNVQMSLWTTAYLATHPIFAEELQSSEGRIRRAKVLAELRMALPDPEAPKAWHLPYLEQMITNFDEFQSAKAQLSGKRDKRSVREREALQAMFVSWADEWVTLHPELRTFWLGIIRPEADLS